MKLTVVIITHEMSVVEKICERGVGFSQMIIEIPKEPASAEKVLAYLGKTGIGISEIERKEEG